VAGDFARSLRLGCCRLDANRVKLLLDLPFLLEEVFQYRCHFPNLAHLPQDRNAPGEAVQRIVQAEELTLQAVSSEMETHLFLGAWFCLEARDVSIDSID
jgi:hypothetical protein